MQYIIGACAGNAHEQDYDAEFVGRRARIREAAKARQRARRKKRHGDTRRCPGAPAQFDLNPHGMEPRTVHRTNKMTRVLRAWENTREYGETVEYVPGNGGHTVLRTQGRPETRAKWDGTHTHWLSAVDEDSCTGERTDKRSRADKPRAWLSYTDMVQHGLVVEE